ncbi:MAG TPA: PDC sensor domain-containing protein [Candidatus Rifleibacterium sp.]|nr:PDC sensor domain-containing protein [Candidatus Rifleibacterium sp.]HPT47647.1 PDC sensor domain-containing protein [Candidatus Rifleibacterium sp.]
MYSINKKMPENIRKYYIYPVTEGLTLAILALFLTAVTSFFIYHHALLAIKAEIKDGLLRTASGIAACLDGNLLASFDSPEKKDLPEYQAMIALLQKARLATKHCTYLYINRMVNGAAVFVVDPTPIDDQGKPLFSDEKNLEPSVPMTPYASPSQELMQALASQTPVVSDEAYTDNWGTFYSAYVPIFDTDKRFVGTLGADLRINDMLERCKPIEDATKRAFFVSCALSLLCGTLIWFTRRFSLQLNHSRFALLENFLAAREFADQTSISIGKQLTRTARLLQNISRRLESIKNSDRKDHGALIQDEYNRLMALAEKLQAVGDLKCGKSETELRVFKMAEVPANLITSLKESCPDNMNLAIDMSKDIPTELYGSLPTYEELLIQMGQFFLKVFAGPVECQFSMSHEGTRDVILRQSMQADVSALDSHRQELLHKLCDRCKDADFFSDIALAEAVSVPIVRELIYLLNSDINLAIENNKFRIFFETLFQKTPEAQDDEED